MTKDKRKRYYDDSLYTLTSSMFRKDYKISPISQVNDTLDQMQEMAIYRCQNIQSPINSIFLQNNNQNPFNKISGNNFLMA